MTKIPKVLNDKFGNALIIVGNTISLKLAGDARLRTIGSIDDQTRTLTVKRVAAKHLYRKMNAYGFNHYLLDNAKRFDMVHIMTDHGDYLIPRLSILEKGSFLHHKQQGFELQIFVRMTALEDYKIAAGI